MTTPQLLVLILVALATVMQVYLLVAVGRLNREVKRLRIILLKLAAREGVSPYPTQSGSGRVDPTERLSTPSTKTTKLDSSASSEKDIILDQQPKPAWLKGVAGAPLDVILDQSPIAVGRGTDQDVVLEDPSVSRRHLTLLSQGGLWHARDEGSPNGTYINHDRIRPGFTTQLQSDDLIRLGSSVTLRFVTRARPEPALCFRAAGATSQGGRPRNEDAYLVDRWVVAVADGVGGRPAGDVAARIAVDCVGRHHGDVAGWEKVVEEIEKAMFAHGSRESWTADMATTLDAARLVVRDGRAFVSGAHIGDGIVVLDDGVQLREMTVPHTVGAKLARDGNPAAQNHPERGRLLQALGFPNIQPDTWEQIAIAGHRYIASTDGIVKALGAKGLAKAIANLRGQSPDDCADALVRLAAESTRIPPEALDNLTIVVADISEKASD